MIESFEDNFVPGPENEEQEIIDKERERLERIRKEKEEETEE